MMRAARSRAISASRPFTTAALAAGALVLGMAPALAQESLVAAEALIRLQDIPLSRPASFESQHSPEQVDFLAWLVVRALDTSSAWNPRNRAWALYRANVRYSLEQSLRQRWQSSAGVIRSLAQNPDTALAKFYADGLSPQELEQALAFFRSDSGKRYVAYQRELNRVFYLGALELDRIGMDPEYGAPGDSTADRRKAWLARKNISLDAVPPGYSLHVRSMQAIYPAFKPEGIVFALVAGAPPGSEAFRRLEAQMAATDRDAVREYLESAAGEKEKKARLAWSDAIVKTRDVLPLMLSDFRSLVDVVAQWRKVRADPRALPRSIAQVEPASVTVDDEYRRVNMLDGAAPELLKDCLPGVSEDTVRRTIENARNRSAISVLSFPEGKNIFLTRQGVGACIPTTIAGYPVPALNSFVGTVSISGMDERDLRAWYKAVAQEIAAFGASESLIVAPNGNAFEVTYAINVQGPQSLIYSTRLLLAGSYDLKRYRTLIKPPQLKSLQTTGNRFPSSEVTRYEKVLLSTPEEMRREQERRAKDDKS